MYMQRWLNTAICRSDMESNAVQLGKRRGSRRCSRCALWLVSALLADVTLRWGQERTLAGMGFSAAKKRSTLSKSVSVFGPDVDKRTALAAIALQD